MPWPLQRHVPLPAFAISASSGGGFVSGIPAAGAAAFAAAFGSAAFGSALGCAATRPVIPTNAIATRETVLMSISWAKNRRTILKWESHGRDVQLEIHRLFGHGADACKLRRSAA